MRPTRARRHLLGIGLAVLAGLATLGLAHAALSVTNAQLAAGDQAVAKCDPDGFTIDALTTNGSGQVTSITIGDIEGNCINGTLTVDLTTSADVSVGTGGPVTVTGSPMTVGIPDLPSASLVKHEVIIIVGP